MGERERECVVVVVLCNQPGLLQGQRARVRAL